MQSSKSKPFSGFAGEEEAVPDAHKAGSNGHSSRSQGRKTFDPTQVKKAYDLFVGEGNVTEVRILGVDGNDKKVESAYVDSYEQFLKYVKIRNGQANGVYFPLNPVNPLAFHRYPNRFNPGGKPTTGGSDILKRRWFAIDLDVIGPVRGINASEEEHAYAVQKAREVEVHLREQFGFPKGMLVSSGNGCWIFFRADLPNDEAATALIKKTLKALDEQFSDGQVKIDQQPADPNRLCKIPGTLAMKSEDSEDRPQRVAAFLDAPDSLEDLGLVTREQLEALASTCSEPQGQTRSSSKGIGEWLEKHGIAYKVVEQGDRVKYQLEQCPFHEHDVLWTKAALFVNGNGAIWFKCFADRCSEKKYRDLVQLWGDRPSQDDHASPEEQEGRNEPSIREFTDYSAEEVEDQPPITWLVDKLLPSKGSAMIYGSWGTWKSFFIEGVSCCIATGHDWFGRGVDKGTVVYVIGEGFGGMGIRLKAWRIHHEVEKGGTNKLRVVDAAPQLLQSGDVEGFLRYLRGLPEKPKLVVFDTLQRMTAGAEENQQKEMTLLVHSMGLIQREFDCLVVMLHHENSQGRVRGSTVLPASFETVIHLHTVQEQPEKIVQLDVEKQRDGEPAKPMYLRGVKITPDPELFPEDNSIVVVPIDLKIKNDLEATRKKVLQVLQRLGQASSTAWMLETEQDPELKMKSGVWKQHRSWLEDLKLAAHVTKSNKSAWKVTERGARWIAGDPMDNLLEEEQEKSLFGEMID